jgi:tetrahydromethanopterin S-methyltransferase subunit G
MNTSRFDVNHKATWYFDSLPFWKKYKVYMEKDDYRMIEKHQVLEDREISRKVMLAGYETQNQWYQHVDRVLGVLYCLP